MVLWMPSGFWRWVARPRSPVPQESILLNWFLDEQGGLLVVLRPYRYSDLHSAALARLGAKGKRTVQEAGALSHADQS